MPTSLTTPSRTASSSNPAPPPNSAAQFASAADDAVAGARALRVFIVDDSAAVRDRLTDFLAAPGRIEILGYADTEAEAVRRIAAQPVDVAIIDLSLKEGTGLGVIEAVRAAHPAPPPVIVVLTNYAFPEFEAACRARGANHFFDKSSQFGMVRTLLQSMGPLRH